MTWSWIFGQTWQCQNRKWLPTWRKILEKGRVKTLILRSHLSQQELEKDLCLLLVEGNDEEVQLDQGLNDDWTCQRCGGFVEEKKKRVGETERMRREWLRSNSATFWLPSRIAENNEADWKAARGALGFGKFWSVHAIDKFQVCLTQISKGPTVSMQSFQSMKC